MTISGCLAAEMVSAEEVDEPSPAEPVERATLCLPNYSTGEISHCGDVGFQSLISQYYPSAESDATEQLVKLKRKLLHTSTREFWALLMEETCDILGAQCGLVAKRILVDDENSAVEMPPLGEPGSCLLGVAFYLNNGTDVKEMHHDYRYHAYGSPCAHMKYDKVFIIPERLTHIVPNSPNKLPWERSEAFIGIPLFSAGKCFAHCAIIWSEEGAAKRPKLSWGFIEMFLHSLEDIIVQRILEGKGFAKEPAEPQSTSARLIPLEAITASQSLKPYARSLSHELRTPMQGVIGMLDIMHSTVMDAIETERSASQRSVFAELRSNIEVVQESSKRAVEAATNVVHAYDLNLQMPDTPLGTDENGGDEDPFNRICLESNLGTVPTGTHEMPWSSTLRKRQRSEELDCHPGPALKRLATVTEGGILRAYRPAMMRTARGTSEPLDAPKEDSHADEGLLVQRLSHKSESGSPMLAPATISPIRRPVVIRNFMHSLINETLKGTHPVTQVSTKSELGETVAIQREGPRGEVTDLTIRVVIGLDVPDIIYTAEQHLHFALEKVLDNAIKFTDSGSITISLKMSRHLIEVRVSDTGCGMTEDSKTRIFKPHFQEDDSISRPRDGLGLSLFNAKAHIRKDLGGDMILERSATDGPNKGSEFLIRLPISPSYEISGLNTPRVGTPVTEPRSTPPDTPRSMPSIRPFARTLTPIPPPVLDCPLPSLKPSPVAITVPAPSKHQRFNSSLATHIPLTILIAEDNVINRQILVGYLRKLGYPMSCIHLAFDGCEAVTKYQRSLREADRRKRINAVLMDLWMPNMDGYEATEKILEMDREWRDRESSGDGTDGEGDDDGVKVIAVTADVTSESMDRARRTGMKGFISKPYKVFDVEQLIVQHFRKNVQEAAASGGINIDISTMS